MSLFDLQSLHNFFFLLKCYMSLFDLHSLCINYIHFKNSESISCCHPVLNFFFVSLLILGNVNSYLFMWFVMYFQVWKTWLSSVFFRSNSTGGKVHDTLCISLIFIWFWTASNQPLIRINLQFALRPVLWRTSVWCMGWSVGGWKSDNTWGGCKLSRWEVGVAAQGLWKDSIQQICGWSCCPSQ